MRVGQAEFRAALLDPAAAVPAGLVGPQGGDAGVRFDVYRNNVVVGLSRALAEAFPVIATLLGDHNFAILARAFLRRHPPQSPLLAEYGSEFPAFLAGFPQVRSFGYLADVARLEVALRQSYHAADADPMDPARLTALPPERLALARLTLAPSVRLVASDWPIVAIRRFHREPGAPKPAMRAETALITRPGYDPVVTDIGPAGGQFASALAGGAPLGAALEAAHSRDPDFNPTGCLSALIAGNALIALDEEAPR
ncbi:DNA-binding domain-containing protein [Tropicimonas sp. IMCC34043]|uniref:HvfC/BufC N-terminal domain-containing protein n=1 Tax=Tropicimonas sp. IMCC34043 TaxID=2248760 RepID=UPI000E258C97|nr:DNA-binding domain-containing protein [Tropicimonas sp. IMCC34043]